MCGDLGSARVLFLFSGKRVPWGGSEEDSASSPGRTPTWARLFRLLFVQKYEVFCCLLSPFCRNVSVSLSC